MLAKKEASAKSIYRENSTKFSNAYNVITTYLLYYFTVRLPFLRLQCPFDSSNSFWPFLNLPLYFPAMNDLQP